jgi:hypothetical protein
MRYGFAGLALLGALLASTACGGGQLSPSHSRSHKGSSASLGITASEASYVYWYQYRSGFSVVVDKNWLPHLICGDPNLYSDIFYSQDSSMTPFQSQDAFGGQITYYGDESYFKVFAHGTAHDLCQGGEIVLTECSPHPYSFHHLVTANLASAASGNFCDSGSTAMANLASLPFFQHTGFSPTDAPGVLGDICNVSADGSCPAGFVPLCRGDVAGQTTAVTTDCSILENPSLFQFAQVIGCAPR